MLYMWPSMYCLLFVCLSVCFLGCLFRIVFFEIKGCLFKIGLFEIKMFYDIQVSHVLWAVQVHGQVVVPA